jgi:hypothetical protein
MESFPIGRYSVGLFADGILWCFFASEGSFIGTAGTSYKYTWGDPYGGQLYFWWCVIAMLIQVGVNIMAVRYSQSIDVLSFCCALVGFVAVAHHGYMTEQDYLELNQSKGFWEVLNTIPTMGNTPSEPVAAEAIHWAMVEMFVMVFVTIDALYCISQLQHLFQMRTRFDLYSP